MNPWEALKRCFINVCLRGQMKKFIVYTQMILHSILPTEQGQTAPAKHKTNLRQMQRCHNSHLTVLPFNRMNLGRFTQQWIESIGSNLTTAENNNNNNQHKLLSQNTLQSWPVSFTHYVQNNYNGHGFSQLQTINISIPLPQSAWGTPIHHLQLVTNITKQVQHSTMEYMSQSLRTAHLMNLSKCCENDCNWYH